MTGNVKKIVVIGNGCAGIECVRSLRDCGYRENISIMTDSKWPIYNPMLTTYFVAGKIDFAGLFPFGANDELASRYKVEINSGSPVVFLDAEKRIVVNKNGLELKYESCLVATGASPVLPPIAGINSSRVFTMRTVEDAMRLKKVIDQSPRKAIVIGASMVGIKLVELFHKAGMEVCLADMAEHLFPLAAHPQCAEVLEARLRRQGIRLRFGAGVSSLVENPGGIRAQFSDNTSPEEADLVVMCVGVRTNLGFIDRHQIECKTGLLVDERMQASALGLYAAGDVAQGKNLLTGESQVIGLWANARYQGRIAGINMAGGYAIMPGSIPQNITHFMGMDFIGIGNPADYDHMEIKDDGNIFIQLFWKNGYLNGANLVDNYADAGVLRYAISKRLRGLENFAQAVPVMQDLVIKNILREVKEA